MANVAGNEPVTSPDQNKRVNPRGARIGAVATILILIALMFPRQEGSTAVVWLIGLVLLIVAMLVGDWVLRRNGLRD
jgi:hypothetical protein